MIGNIWAFLGISIFVIVTPGPDTALTIRNTLFGGARSGVFTALGVAIGQSLWALATSVGIVGLLVASATAFAAVKFLGAAYLVYLGAQTLYGALRRAGSVEHARGQPPARRLGPLVALRQGVVNDLANPKMAAFFTSLLPQFAPDGAGAFSVLMLLGFIFSGLTLAWLTGYALAVAKLGDLLRRSGIRRAIEALTGAALLGLGLRVAAEQR
jgi:threonine/homoserine/homoserine lactone efflux protein